MANVKIHKVTALPGVLDVNAVYFVKTGAKVAIYVTDSAGTPYNGESDPVYTAAIPDLMMYKAIIPSGVNLNSYQTTGIYLQNSNANAGSGTNYPEAYAGMLEVQSDTGAGFTFQRYTTYQQVGTSVYKRSYYAGAWSGWVRMLGQSEGVVYAANSGNMFNGYPGNSILSESNTAYTPDGGNGISWNGAINNSGGIYSAQMYIGFSTGPAGALDSFWYRANQQGGPGWPTQWYQVASRLWANTNLIQNQSSVTQTANFIISGAGRMGKLGVGVAAPANYLSRFGGNVAGSGNNYGGVTYVNPSVQSDITTAFYGIVSEIATQATTFTLSNINHFYANNGVFGAGSTVTNQNGFRVAPTMIGATNNYAFRGELPASGLTNWNTYMTGNAPNYFAGSVGIGNTALTTTNLRITKAITGGVGSYGMLQDGTVQSDVTSSANGVFNSMNIAAAAFTLAEYTHFYANQNTIGSGATVTVQSGFKAHSTMIGATNNYGFYGVIPAGTGRWNLYMSGTADNHIAGRLGLGTTGLTTANLRNSKTLTGGFAAQGIQQDGSVQSDVTVAYGYDNISNTQAAAFTVSDYTHFQARQGTIGAGSAITRQAAFQVSSNMSGATNNYGFSGQLQFGTGRWNIYMSGSADNYFAGNVGIGINNPVSALHLAAGRYLRLSSIAANTILKTNTDSDVVAAVAGTDYLEPGGVIQNQNAATQPGTFKIDGTGESTTTLAAPTVKVNTIMPYSGSGTLFGGDVMLSTVSSKLLKTDVTGKIVPAVSNVDYVEYVGETVVFASTTQTLSVNDAFPTANTTACVVYCDCSGGNMIITLPGVIDITGKGPIHFIKTDNSGNKVVVKGAGTTLINNLNQQEMIAQYQKMTVRGGDGGQYWLF